MFLNQNNFCRWGDLINLNPEMSGSGGIDNWTLDDVAPIGDNESPWTNIGDNAVVINGATESTKGLSQPVKIRDGHRYMINWEIKENLYGDTDFYIYFVSGNRNQQAVIKRIGATGNVRFQHEVVADNDYSKVLVCAIAVAGVGISAYVNELRVTDIGTCDYRVPLLKDDTLSIYGNVEFDSTEITFGTLKVGLWKIDEGPYLEDITAINQNTISGNIYAFYLDDWIVPDLPRGLYSFYLYDDSGELQVYYWSNIFSKISSANYTSLVKYRNDANTLGYQYEDITTFYNQFRVDLRTGRPNFKEEVQGYETYTGDLIKTKSDINKLIEFNTRFMDDGAHEAFFSMLAHSEILIDSDEYKRGSGDDYTITWSEDDDNKIGNGVVNLQRVDYSAAVKRC